MRFHSTMRKGGNKPDLLDPDVREFFGRKIKLRRLDLNSDNKGEWTRAKVGGMIGISETAIGNIERGENFPSPARLIRLTLALDISFDKVLPRRLVQSRPVTPEGEEAPARKRAG